MLLLLVGPRLALGGPLGFGSAPGFFGCLRVALRTRLSGLFARFGRVRERCRVLDAVCVNRSRGDAAPRAPECVPGRVVWYVGALRLSRLLHTIIPTRGAHGGRDQDAIRILFCVSARILGKQPNVNHFTDVLGDPDRARRPHHAQAYEHRKPMSNP